MNTLKYIICLSFIATASISANMLAPALPYIKHAYQLSSARLNWVMSVYLLGYVVGQLIYGPLANNVGRMTAMRIGFIINLLGITLSIISTYTACYGLLLCGRIVTALGASAGLACTFMLLKELLTPEQNKRSMAHVNVAFGIGIGLSTMLGGLLTQYGHWVGIFWLLGGYGLALLALTFLFSETLTTPIALHPRNIVQGYKNALSSKSLLTASLCVGFATALNYCYATAAPSIVLHNLGLNIAQYGMLNWINVGSMLLISIVGANFMQRYGAKKCLKNSLILLLPSLLALTLMPFFHHVSIILFYITTATMFAVSRIIYSSAAYIATHAITDTANASSMMSFINLLSATMSVTLMGYLPLSHFTSYAVICMSFYVLCMFVIGRDRRCQKFTMKTSMRHS